MFKKRVTRGAGGTSSENKSEYNYFFPLNTLQIFVFFKTEGFSLNPQVTPTGTTRAENSVRSDIIPKPTYMPKPGTKSKSGTNGTVFEETHTITCNNQHSDHNILGNVNIIIVVERLEKWDNE